MDRVTFAVKELLNPKTSEFYVVTVNFVLQMIIAGLAAIGLTDSELKDISAPLANILNVAMIAGGTRVTSKLAKGPGGM